MNAVIDGTSVKIESVSEIVFGTKDNSFVTLQDFQITMYNNEELYQTSGLMTKYCSIAPYGSGRIIGMSFEEETNYVVLQITTTGRDARDANVELEFPRVFGHCIRVQPVQVDKKNSQSELVTPLINRGQDHEAYSAGICTKGLSNKVGFSYGTGEFATKALVGKMPCYVQFQYKDDTNDNVAIRNCNFPRFESLYTNFPLDDPDAELPWIVFLSAVHNPIPDLQGYYLKFNFDHNGYPAFAQCNEQEGRKLYLDFGARNNPIFYVGTENEQGTNFPTDHAFTGTEIITEVRAVPHHSWLRTGSVIPFKLEAGSKIRPFSALDNVEEEVFVVCDSASVEVQEVVSRRMVNEKEVFSPIPSSYYSVNLADNVSSLNPEYPNITVTTVRLLKDITELGENWTNDLFVTVVSARPHSVEDIIQFHVDEYTSMTLEYNAPGVVQRNFCLYSEYDPIELIKTLCHEAHLTCSIDAETVEVNDMFAVTGLNESNLDNVIQYKFDSTDYASVVTEFEIEVTTDYSVDPVKFTLTRNTEKWGYKKESYSFQTVTSEKSAREITEYWCHKRSDVFKTFVLIKPLEEYSMFSIAEFTRPDSVLSGLITDIRYNLDNYTTTITAVTTIPVSSSAEVYSITRTWSRGQYPNPEKSPVDYPIVIGPGWGPADPYAP